MSLILEDVSYTYQPGTSYGVQALDSVSLLVAPGEMVLVVGSTGSGKSSLLRIACGLLTPSAGRVSIDGAPLTRDAMRGRVGLVFQEPEAQLFADTVLDDIAFGPLNLGLTREEAHQSARHAMGRVRLDPALFSERSPFTLSGGEARRVAMAGVLAMSPDYLLLDEPTAGLDASGRRAVRFAIAQSREDAGVVIVSHDSEEFLAEADRLVVLEGGRVVADAAGPDLLADPWMIEPSSWTPPPVLAVQMLAAKHLGLAGPFTLNPLDAADHLADQVGER